MNEDSQRKNERGSFLVNSLGLSNVLPVKKIFVLAWLLNRSSTKYFFLAYLSIPLSPSPSKLGRQSCWVACLLLCVSGLLSNPVSITNWKPVKGGSLDGLPYLLTFRRRRTDSIHQPLSIGYSVLCISSGIVCNGRLFTLLEN